jgi:hypothetical protein
MRISTTTLESFRLFMQPDQEWMTEQSLIDTISGLFVPTAAVLLGKAYGQVLETPDLFAVPGGYDCGGYRFALKDVDPALAVIDRRGVFEAKAVKAYGPHDVVAKADHLLGTHLSEFKTTGSTFDFDKYAASCQWRFMTDIFEPSRITYHVFELDDHGNSVAELKAVHSFDLYPYAALHQDCCDLVTAFVSYVTAKGLDALLIEKQRVAEGTSSWAA